MEPQCAARLAGDVPARHDYMGEEKSITSKRMRKTRFRQGKARLLQFPIFFGDYVKDDCQSRRLLLQGWPSTNMKKQINCSLRSVQPRLGLSGRVDELGLELKDKRPSGYPEFY
jgi:hypothetical protein